MTGSTERKKTAIGDLAGVMALFDKARAHLKAPAVVLAGDGGELRLSLAGQGARVPDSINVTDNRGWGDSTWFGRIMQDGQFEASPRVETPPWLVDHLKRFAADPARVVAASGHLTGKCSLCGRPLTDARSTAAGFGAKCASNWGIPYPKIGDTVKRKDDLFAEI